MRQLPLGIRLGLSHRFETFHVGANAEAVAALVSLSTGAGRAPLWLCGPPGSGKSHLLQAACALAGASGQRAACLPLSKGQGAELLGGYEQLPLVALDDLDEVAGDAAWEHALFTLYNELAERGGRLVLAAARPPAVTGIRLPDLASRLAASEVHRLEPLGEADQGEALRRRARHRGLELPDETLLFLTRRAPRDFATLCRMLDELDTESLAARRRLTVPFVRDWLARATRATPS